MWDYLVIVSTWVENNSGQIQIFIGVVALTFAWMAYKKVLHQIKISDHQTDLTIVQMEKLSKERVFELKFRLTSRIGEHSNTLNTLQNSSNNLSLRIQVLVIETGQNYSASLEAIKGLEEVFRSEIQQFWAILKQKRERMQILKKQINEEVSVEIYEKILIELEENQNTYNTIFSKIENTNNTIDSLWNGLKTGDALAGAKITNGLI